MRKLVRDKIPEIFPGNAYESAPDEERLELLVAKLHEETAELTQEISTPGGDLTGILGELADLHEVLSALMNEFAISERELEQVRTRKAAERGAFENTIVMTEYRP